jgi:NAD+ kinase
LAAKLIPSLLIWLEEHRMAVRLDRESAAYASYGEGLLRADVAAQSDLLVVLGGDGTLLSAARAAVGRDIPIFPVNLGGLGFLTAITVEELWGQLERALRSDFDIARRRMLHTELFRGDQSIASHHALNDMVLTKGDIARMIDLDVFIDRHFVCVYRADGLIVATPTGSTAYSLSAGGPIVMPQVAALAITPICPHMLSNRPVIVPEESRVEITVRGTASTYMTIDGQVGQLLETGDRVVCRRSEHSISLIRPPGKLFFDVLREKLNWGGR